MRGRAFFVISLTLLLTRDRLSERHDGLPRFAGDVRTVVVSGERAGLFVTPGVDEVGRELQRCMAEVEASP